MTTIRIHNKLERYDRFENAIRFLTDGLFVPDENYIEALYAQAALETGHFTSNIYLRGNNLFGMRQSVIRDRWWSDSISGHAAYTHHIMSVLDRIDWDMWHNIRYKDFHLYTHTVQDHGYATDREYLIKWQKLFENINAIKK